MSFQIRDSDNKVIGMKELREEVAEFWGSPPNQEPWPPTTSEYRYNPGDNWVDVIGYTISQGKEYFGMDWENVKKRLFLALLEERQIEDYSLLQKETEDIIKYVKPFYALMDHWKEKGYRPLRTLS